MPMYSGLILIVEMRGACSRSCERVSGIASAILSRMNSRARRAWSRLERPLRERAVADVAPLRAAHEACLPDRVRREVVVVHEPALRLERQVVDPLALLRGAQRQQRHDLRLAAGEQRRAVRARREADLARDRTDVLPPT